MSKKTKQTSIQETAAADTLKAGSRAAMLSDLVKFASGVDTTTLTKLHDDAMKLSEKAGDGVDSGAAGKNKASVNAKGDASKLVVKEAVSEMFGEGEEFSDEFKTKATVLFEAAVEAKVAEITASIREEVEADVETKLEEQIEEMTTKIDEYLNYTVEQWLEKNEVAITSSMRQNYLENVFSQLKKVLAESNVKFDDSEVDLISSVEKEKEEVTEQLNTVVNENLELRKELLVLKAEKIVSELAEGMTVLEKDKFVTLAETVEFDEDLEDFKKKLEIIKEQHSSKPQGKSVLNEEVDTKNVITSDPRIDATKEALRKALAKR